jgi:hypothetical protein
MTYYSLYRTYVQKRNIMTSLAAGTRGTVLPSTDFENYCSRAASERRKKIIYIGILLPLFLSLS